MKKVFEMIIDILEIDQIVSTQLDTIYRNKIFTTILAQY